MRRSLAMENNYIIRLEKKEEYRTVENLVRESFWNFCDIPYAEDLEEFNRAYLENTSWVCEHCENTDLSSDIRK